MKSILIADDKPENLRQLEAKMLELEQRNRELEADIAARQQVEARLQKSEARFRAYVEQAAEVIVVHDFAGKFLEVNQQACETLGYTREELLRMGVFDIEIDFDVAQAQAVWQQIIPGRPGTARGRHRRKDGSIFPVEMRFGAFDVKGERFYVGMARDITERLQAEAELQRMRFGVDHADDAIFWVSREGSVLYANESACTRSGYSHTELLGMKVFDLDPDFPVNSWPGHWTELQHSGSLTFETSHRCKDGRVFPVEVNANYVQAGGQEFNFAFVRDITERKRSEQRIRQLNRIYSVMNDINQLIVRERDPQVILENACGIAVTNGGFLLAWIGIKEAPSGVLRLRAHAGATGDNLAVIQQMLESPNLGCAFASEALATGQSAVCNDIASEPRAARWRAAALQRGYQAMAAFPLAVAGQRIGTLNLYAGNPGFFDAEELQLLNELAIDISFALEVTQREAQRQKIEESHARLGMAVEQASEIIFITDPQGTIVYANPAFAKTTGYTCAEAIGRNPRILKSGKQTPEFYRQMWATIKGGQVWQGHFTNQRKDGTLFEEEATISPIRDTQGTIINFVSVKRDVTHELELESRFRQAQKMEAVGTLAGGIAHDFNNILAAVFGFAYLLQQDTEGNPVAQENVADMLKSLFRAKDLVQQILTFSRKREQNRQIIALDTVVKEATRFLRASLPAEIKLEIKLAEDAPAVLADATQIYQLIVNLGTNAQHAMEGRPGRLTVSLQAFRPSAAFVQLHSDFRPGLYTCLSVADTGCGMDTNTMERIYEPFFTTKPVGKGTGLGLAVVHGIVKSHDGLITLDSKVGQGTTFGLYFPAQANSGTSMDANDNQVPNGSGQKILLLDDEPAVTKSVERLLVRLNYEVTISHNAREVVELFRKNPMQFDLLITDLTMPDINGIAVARQVHSVRLDLPILLFSGYAPDLDAENLAAIGIRGRLVKPVAMVELAEAVKLALAAGQTAL